MPLLVLALGIALRTLQPTLVEFKRDEATIARLGQAIAYEGYLPAVGVDSSLGIDNLPLTLYLAAIPLRLWSDPLALVVFTCLVNSLALVACYVFTHVAFGRAAALFATALFFVSPWAVLYARKVWARTLPLFTLAFVVALYLTFVKRRRWALVGAFVSLAALLGLQLEALAFVPVLGLMLVLYHRGVGWRPLLVGLLVCGLLLLPYVVHDVRNGWQNLRGLAVYAGRGGAASCDAVRYALSLLGGRGIEGQAGPYHLRFREELGPFWWLNDTLSILLVLSLVYGLAQAIQSRHRERRRTFVLLLLWFIVPVMLQVRPSAPTQRHYYVMHYPVQYVLIGAFVQAAGRWLAHRFPAAIEVGWRRIVIALVAIGMAAGSAWQVSVTVVLRRYMVDHPSTGGYGIPLRYTRRAAAEARALGAGGEVIVLSEDTKSLMTETPTVFDALLFGVDHRFADGRGAVPLPERDRVAYVVGPLAPTEDGASELTPIVSRLHAAGSLVRQPGVVLPDGVAYWIYTLAEDGRGNATTGMTPLAAGIPFANNVVFAAQASPTQMRPSKRAEVWLAWWLRGAAASEDYHFTVQLLDGEGQLLSQDDHAAFPSGNWRAGDIVLSRFVVVAPEDAVPGEYHLRAGMYTYPNVIPVAVVDGVGAPIDDGVTLRPTPSLNGVRIVDRTTMGSTIAAPHRHRQ